MRIKQIRQRDSGQSMVEFALVLPFLMLILCLIIDFGWVFSKQNELTSVAGATARYVSINYAEHTDDLSSCARTYAEANPFAGTLTGVDASTDASKTYVKVTLTEDVPYLTGFTGVFTGRNYISLHATAAMPITSN